MDGDGIVAVVRGTKGAGLSVTLLPNVYFKGDTQKFNINNDSIYARVTQSNAQTNTERIPQNIRRYNVTYQLTNYYKPSVNYILPFPQQKTKRIYMKNLRAHPKFKKQQSYRHNRNEYNKTNDGNQEENYTINSSVHHSLTSVEATSSSQKEFTKYMYDYLKSESLVPKVDVRYFTEIKKVLRNGLRRITDRNIPCPMKRSRYYQHKRYGNCSKHSLTDSVTRGTKVLKYTMSSNISKRKCFCHQPLTCECDTTKKTVTNEYISRKYLDESNKKSYSKNELKENIFDVSAPGDFTDSKYQKIFDVISKWVRDMPKHPNFNENDKSKQDMIIGQLAKILKEIFNTEDFVIRARPEIVKWLNTFPILQLDDATDEARFIEELINDLIRRFADLAESDFVECISSEIKKIAFENNISVDNMQSKINHFVDELIPIALKRPKNNESYKEILETKLIELFKNYNLMDDIKDSNNINVLGEKFADRLCHIYLYNFSNEGEINQDNIVERKFLDWLKDTPELSNINVNQCLKIMKSLMSKYSHYKQEDYKNKETEKKVEDDIKTFLDLIENKLHISFSTRRKEELIKQLKWLLFGIERTVKDEDDTYLSTVMEWLLTIPGLSEQNIMKNEEDIKKYAILMKEVQTHMNNKLPNVKKVISNWLQNFLRKNNIRLDPKAYDNLINKLIHKVNDLSNPTSVVIKPRKRWDNLEYRYKYSNIRNIVDVCFNDFGINVKEVTKRKIVEEILKNIADSNILWDKVLKNLMLIMSKDTSLEQNTIKNLSNHIIHRVKNLFIPNKRNERNHMTPQQHKFTSDGGHQEEPLLVNLSLNSQLMDRSNKVNKKIQTQQSEKETKQAHTSEGDLKEKNNQQVDLSEISQYKTSANNTLDGAESKVSREFLGPNDGNDFSSTENNNDKMISMKEYYSESSSILENIKAVSSNLVDQKIDKLKKLEENNQYHIRKVSNSTQTEQENLSFDNNFTTSTPVSYSQKKISISNKLSTENNQINKKEISKKELSEHSQYLNDARSAIYNWLKLFNIDVSSLEKNNLTEIILSDYLERQKYLQLSGIKTKENDELEQLKYQIYRQMYKLTNSEMLQMIMAKVTDLYENLKTLKHYKTSEEEQISDAKLKTLSTENFNELTQKIRVWLNSFSSQFHVLSDKNYEENMIQDLSKSLYLLKKEGNYKTHGKDIITTWLQKVLNVSDINELNDLSESLMIYIENDSLRDTQIPIQDISEFLIENLKGAILDWLREIRPFPRNTMLNLPFLEDFASLLANDLKMVFENNSNIWSNDFENLLTEEIVKNFKNILSHDDKDSTFYQKLAKNLLTYIKQLRIFHSISDRLTIDTLHEKDLTNEYKYGNKIKQAIFLWSKNLALETGKSYEDIEESIRGFVEKIFTYIREDINSIENRLKQDTLKLLEIIPLKIHQERNIVLQNCIKSLINTIKDNIDLHDSIELIKEIDDKIDSHANETKSHLKNIDEYIYDIIKNWCDILPFHVDSKEKNKEIKQNLVSQIIRFIQDLNSNDDVPKKNVYKVLHDHIKEQVKTLCTTPDLENCMDLLIDVLIKRLKDAKCLNVKKSIGSIYSLLLYETINKTLSFITNPSGDDQISLDLLKEKLANAFIELHYPTDNVDILSKYKDELYNVISKFCEEYLKQSFIIPRDRKKVKEDLDEALSDVSIPKLNISKEISVNTNEMIVTKRHISTQCDLNIIPSILSIEDIGLLNNIRSRSRYLARSNARQDSIKIFHKDVSINPMPVDADTQTEIQFIKNITDGITQTSRHSLNERVSLRKEISPQMIIKEYYWDSSGSNQSLRMSILSEVSQKIDRVPSVLVQTEDFAKNNLISSNQPKSSKAIETDVSTKKKETAHTQTNVPTKNTKNSSQQTSNTFEPIILPSTSRLEVNQNEIDNLANDEDNRIDIDPKSKRTVIPSDEIPSRHKLNIEGDGDVHIKTSKRHKHVTNDASKMMSENREMESYKDMFKFNKGGQNCNCKDYIFSKCRNRINICGRQSNLKHCAKGYGCFCPYPSNLFFKKEC